MSDEIEKRVSEIRASEVFKLVKEIQASMVESARPAFDESESGHLRAVIRLTVEFRDYLEHGSTKIATSILHGPHAKYVTDAASASADPFNRHDLQFLCESIQSGVDSFCSLNQNYRTLEGATESMVRWGMTSSVASFKTQFVSMFDKFTQEISFESKCRLLLDLFKLQMVFAAVLYE